MDANDNSKGSEESQAVRLKRWTVLPDESRDQDVVCCGLNWPSGPQIHPHGDVKELVHFGYLISQDRHTASQVLDQNFAVEMMTSSVRGLSMTLHPSWGSRGAPGPCLPAPN